MSEVTTRGRDYRAEIELAVRETRRVIDEALGYIRRQEDGPMTMRHSLQEIKAQVDILESELYELYYNAENLNRIIERVSRQRDETIRQREMVMIREQLPDDPDEIA